MRKEKIEKIYKVFSLESRVNCVDAYHVSKAIKQVGAELRDGADESEPVLEYYAAAIAYLSRQRMVQNRHRIELAERLVLAYRSAAANLLAADEVFRGWNKT